MDIKSSSVIIRPELAAPEVDDYDEVPTGDIVTQDIGIGSYIEYTLSAAGGRESNTDKNQFSH
jgi:hypothetical protein